MLDMLTGASGRCPRLSGACMCMTLGAFGQAHASSALQSKIQSCTPPTRPPCNALSPWRLQILETKISKLEQLVRLKDAKIQALLGKLQAAEQQQPAPDDQQQQRGVGAAACALGPAPGLAAA